MRLNDLKNRVLGIFSHGESDTSRRPDGGTSCYRPIRRKSQEEIRGQEEQPLTYIHTGFTGMNPPANTYDTGFGMDAYGQQAPYGQQAAYGQNAPYGQQTAYGQQGVQYGQQTAYGQPGPYAQQTAYVQQGAPAQQTAYGQQGVQYGQQTAYGQPVPFAQPPYAQQDYTQQTPGRNEKPRGGFRSAGRARTEEPASAARPDRGWFPPHEEAPAGNISYMPGYAPDAGAAPFNHVEHILIMTGLKSCYEAIECMKNGETLIVFLDAIANENESMRCQDMLAGAAFTLGCSVRMLQGARLVLISPEGVKVLPEEAPARQEAVPPVYAAPAADQGLRQRERRSGRNAAEWNAAHNTKPDGLNPYTGTMPVAAGAYASFGGYGY